MGSCLQLCTPVGRKLPSDLINGGNFLFSIAMISFVLGLMSTGTTGERSHYA